MTYQELLRFAANNNNIVYFRVPFFHKELFGTSKPCNSFQLMWLLGSERNMKHYEKAEVPEHCICHIPVGRFNGIGKGPMKLTKEMNENYPWLELAKSIKEEGFRVPVVAELQAEGFLTIEGRHRVAACTLIEPFDPNFPVPCIVVVRDPFYTVKMYKQRHPDPLDSCGYKTYHNK